MPFQNVGRLLVLSLGTSGCCTCPLVSILLTLFIIFLKTFGCFFTRFRVSFGSFLRLKRYNSLDFFAWYIDWANSDFVSLLSTWDLMPSGYPHINFQSLYLNNFISNYCLQIFVQKGNLSKEFSLSFSKTQSTVCQ